MSSLSDLEAIFTDGIHRKDGTAVQLDAIFETNDLIGIYFAKFESNTSKIATDAILTFYKDIRAKGQKFEIILLSADESQEEYNENYKPMPWLAAPWNPAVAARFSRKQWVFAPPRMLLFTSDGQVTSREGVALVQAFPEKYPWKDRMSLNRCLFKLSGRVLIALLAIAALYGILLSAI